MGTVFLESAPQAATLPVKWQLSAKVQTAGHHVEHRCHSLELTEPSAGALAEGPQLSWLQGPVHQYQAWMPS